MRKRKLKIRKLEPMPKKKVGRIFSNDVHFETHEYETIILLAQFGFDIEPAKQNNTPETHNADISMLGTTWEMKSPEKFREKTIKKRINEASHQADHIIFDLRRIKSDDRTKAKDFLVEMLVNNHAIRRMMVIVSSEEILDIEK